MGVDSTVLSPEKNKAENTHSLYIYLPGALKVSMGLQWQTGYGSLYGSRSHHYGRSFPPDSVPGPGIPRCTVPETKHVPIDSQLPH